MFQSLSEMFCSANNSVYRGQWLDAWGSTTLLHYLLKSFLRCLQPAFHAVAGVVLAEMHMEVLSMWQTSAYSMCFKSLSPELPELQHRLPATVMGDLLTK